MSYYFRNVPNLRYKNPLDSSNTRDNFVLTKNLFLRTKLRDDAQSSITFLQAYTIDDGERPEDTADRLYNDPTYDWIVLTVANIINVRDEWPLGGKNLYKYALNKYGNDDMNATAFYETTEVKDAQGRLILPAGLKVDSNYTIPHPDNVAITLNPVIGITNYLAETRKNERKRHIRVMRPEYLTTFLMDMRKELAYTKSSQYESRGVKKAHNPTAT